MLKVMQRGECSCCTTTSVVPIDTHRIANVQDYFELLLLLCLVIFCVLPCCLPSICTKPHTTIRYAKLWKDVALRVISK